GKDRIDRIDLLDIARQHQRGADRFGERLDAPAERVTLIGEGERRALAGEHASNTPGDRVIVGDPHHQSALATHYPRHVLHPSVMVPPSPRPAFCRAPAHWLAKVSIWAHASSRLNTTDALVPPNPNEFDSTQLSATSSRRSRMIGMSANAGSRFSMFALSQMNPLFIIRRE